MYVPKFANYFFTKILFYLKTVKTVEAVDASNTIKSSIHKLFWKKQLLIHGGHMNIVKRLERSLHYCSYITESISDIIYGSGQALNTKNTHKLFSVIIVIILSCIVHNEFLNELINIENTASIEYPL